MSVLTLCAALLCAPPLTLSDEQIAAAIAQLGHDEFEVRRQATDTLWRAGRSAESALRTALHSPDAETRLQAATLLNRFFFGIGPESPPEIARWVHQFRLGDYRTKLDALQSIRDAGAVATLFATIDSEANQDLRDEFDRRFLADIEVSIRKLLIRDQWARAEEFLELAAARNRGMQHYAALLLLTGKASGKIEQLAQKEARTPGESALLGELRRCQRGEEVNVADILRTPALDPARAVAGQMIQFHRAGKAPTAERLQRLQDQYLDMLPPAHARTIRFLTQLASRRPHRALAALQQWPDQNTLAILRRERRLEEALRLVGLTCDTAEPQRRSDPPIADEEEGAKAGAPTGAAAPADALMLKTPDRDWLLQLTAQSDVSTGPDRFLAAMEVAHLLERVGARAHAARLTQLIAAELLAASPYHKLHLVWLARHELAIGQEAAGIEHASLALSQSEAKTAFQAMFGGDADLAEVWWDSFRRLDTAELPSQTVRQILGILNPSARPDMLLERVRQVAAIAAGFDKFGRARYFQALGETCMRHAEAASAVVYFQEAAQATSDANHWVAVGHALAKMNRFDQAADAYAAGFERQGAAHFARYLEGLMRGRAGDSASSQRLTLSAMVLPLGTFVSRQRLAEELWNQGQREAAIQQWSLALLLESAPGNNTVPVRRRLAAAIGDQRPAEAARQLEAALDQCLYQQECPEPLAALWDDAVFSLQLRYRSCLAEKRWDLARDILDEFDRLGPSGLAAIVERCTAADGAPMSDDQPYVDRAIAALDQLCSRFPADRLDRLDLARLGLSTRSHLALAEQRAAEVLQLEPASAAAMELLAQLRALRETRP